MKRFFYFMMTVVLVFSLAVTAFADDDGSIGSITITNATVGKTYSVFKIFSATVKDGNTTYSIKPEDPFFVALFGDGTAENDYFVYHESTGVITKIDGTDDEALIAYLTTLVNGKTPTVNSIEAGTETVEFEGLDYGYYVITSTLGAAVTIDEVTPTAEIIDKNQKSTKLDKMIWDKDSEEWVKESSANVGDVVNFKVTFTATNYDGETKIDKYTITDTLTPTGWASINTDSIEVKVEEKKLTKDTDYRITTNDNGFKIEIPWVDDNDTFKYDSTSNVVITYSATVLKAAASEDPANTENKNTVKSDWDDDGDSTTTKVYNMGFTKVDGTNGTPLSGAKFELYSDAECTAAVNVSKSSEGVYIVDPTSGTNVVETPAAGDTTVAGDTTEAGEVVIMGLKEGIYYLKETEAPAGYNMMDDATPIEVKGNIINEQKVQTTYTVHNIDTDIKNNQGVELPSTGGEGTTMLITIGSMVALAFAVLLITHKKMSVYHD